MPNYRGHLVGGACAFVLLCFPLQATARPVTTLIEWFFCALFGALFPDIDTKSKGQLLFYRLMIVVMGLLCMQQRFMVAAGTGLFCMLPMIVRHRGLFHNYLFMTTLLLLIAFLVFTYKPSIFNIIAYDLLFFSAGLYSHLFLDFRPWKRLKFSRR